MAIIQQTHKEEQADILNTPIVKLAGMCQRPERLAAIVSIAWNEGYKLGQEQAHRYYRMMLAGQDETTIMN